MYRIRNGTLEVLLVHPGGPFWKNKDTGAWSIPKGEVNKHEHLLEAAQREFHEELGLTPTAPFHPLGSIKQKAGKIVHAWAFQGDCNPTTTHCNTNVEFEWPPKSGEIIAFPEIDRADFFTVEKALTKINPAQIELLSRLEQLTRENGGGGGS
jgi:predicted NUDIX family NTP pyrophosphohydrolase